MYTYRVSILLCALENILAEKIKKNKKKKKQRVYVKKKKKKNKINILDVIIPYLGRYQSIFDIVIHLPPSALRHTNRRTCFTRSKCNFRIRQR